MGDQLSGVGGCGLTASAGLLLKRGLPGSAQTGLGEGLEPDHCWLWRRVWVRPQRSRERAYLSSAPGDLAEQVAAARPPWAAGGVRQEYVFVTV